MIAHRGAGDLYLILGTPSKSYQLHQNGFSIAFQASKDTKPFKIGMANAQQLIYPSTSTTQYSQVLEEDPININALNGISQSYLLMYDFENAQKYCQESLDLKPENNPNAIVACANVNREKGNHTEATSLYLEVLGDYPNHSMALFGLGVTQFEMHEYQNAIDNMKRGIQNVRYYNPEYLLIIGDSYKELGETESSEEYYNKALDKLPANHYKYSLIKAKLDERLSETN